MIEFEDVRIAYKDKPVLDGVSLTIHDREFFVLIGSSGCGKTTLLKSINKLLPLRGGSLSIDGIPVEQIKVQDLPKKVGYVVQSGGLVPPPDGGRKHRPHHADRPFFQRGHPGSGR